LQSSKLIILCCRFLWNRTSWLLVGWDLHWMHRGCSNRLQKLRFQLSSFKFFKFRLQFILSVFREIGDEPGKIRR
jgi:hypothetical protein